ncbi:ROK family transcriptional regulator [uncultured Sphingomonas sp.]|uniref:ROK family transcriptional regulator n=1 Tax=uncultured Sphingomonas sp. TaxID=158754 RepID=UPI0025E970E5|nr:ROK family transcriptional regulator [uncultured Sphingomonas sp.]
MLTDTHANVLRLINQFGPLSRTELVEQLGISKASMSALAADLLGRGMLMEGETVYGTGRPAVRLALSASSAFFIGVSLSTAPFALTLTDLHGEVLDATTFSHGSGAEAIVAEIARAAAAMLEAHPDRRERVAGIGLAVPGVVDATSGICVRSTLLDWRDLPIGSMVAEATGLPVFVENDANALALGERLFGSLRGCEQGTMIAVGEGIGCGHLIKGDLHRGARGGAGEIAHATVEPNGLPCQCGKRGCLDTLASLRSITAHARDAGLPDSIAALEVAAAQGRRGAIDILHRAGTALGLAVAQIVQSLDPEHIVVALTDGPADGLYVRVMRQTAEANVMPDHNRKLILTTMRLDQRAWAVGAASIAAERGFFKLAIA